MLALSSAAGCQPAPLSDTSLRHLALSGPPSDHHEHFFGNLGFSRGARCLTAPPSEISVGNLGFSSASAILHLLLTVSGRFRVILRNLASFLYFRAACPRCLPAPLSESWFCQAAKPHLLQTTSERDSRFFPVLRATSLHLLPTHLSNTAFFQHFALPPPMFCQC